MEGLIWVVATWSVVLPLGRRQFGLRLDREQLGLVVALVGIHSTAVRPTAAVLGDPLVAETALRGALAATALVLATSTYGGESLPGRRGRWPAFTGLAAYWLVAAASVGWSVAVAPTAGKAFELGVGLVVVWRIAVQDRSGASLRHAIRLVLLLEFSLLVVAIVGFAVQLDAFSELQSRPGFVLDRVLISPFAHSNGLSAAGSAAGLYALALALAPGHARQRWHWHLMAATSAIAIVLSSGRQGLVTMLCGTLVLMLVHRRRWVPFIAVPVALFVASQWDLLWQAFTRGGEQIETLTGRTLLWSAAIEAWREQPLAGYGFGAGGPFVTLDRLGLESTSSVHSGYIEALVGLGVLGVVLLGYVVVRVVVWALRELRRRSVTPEPILVVPLLLHTSVTLGFGGWLTRDFFLFAALAALSDLALGRPGRSRLRRAPIAARHIARRRAVRR